METRPSSRITRKAKGKAGGGLQQHTFVQYVSHFHAKPVVGREVDQRHSVGGGGGVQNNGPRPCATVERNIILPPMTGYVNLLPGDVSAANNLVQGHNALSIGSGITI